VLDGLPDAELARIPTPTKPALVAELAAARGRRAKAKAPKKAQAKQKNKKAPKKR